MCVCFFFLSLRYAAPMGPLVTCSSNGGVGVYVVPPQAPQTIIRDLRRTLPPRQTSPAGLCI